MRPLIEEVAGAAVAEDIEAMVGVRVGEEAEEAEGGAGEGSEEID